MLLLSHYCIPIDFTYSVCTRFAWAQIHLLPAVPSILTVCGRDEEFSIAQVPYKFDSLSLVFFVELPSPKTYGWSIDVGCFVPTPMFSI